VTAVRFRALVLAAGRGERLRPLTDRLPKPLLPVAGQPVAAHTLARLAAAGCEAAAINLHHQGELIRKRFGGRFGAMPLTYSEEPERLGTLGALWPLRDFLAAAELVVVINGDSLCRWPVKTLLRRHRARRAAATLLLARRADPAGFGGGVGVDRDRRIVSFRPGGPAAGDADRRWVFAGAQVLSPELLARLRPGPADIVRDLYEPLLGEGRCSPAARPAPAGTTSALPGAISAGCSTGRAAAGRGAGSGAPGCRPRRWWGAGCGSTGWRSRPGRGSSPAPGSSGGWCSRVRGSAPGRGCGGWWWAPARCSPPGRGSSAGWSAAPPRGWRRPPPTRGSAG
jgi:hypothetical protein